MLARGLASLLGVLCLGLLPFGQLANANELLDFLLKRNPVGYRPYIDNRNVPTYETLGFGDLTRSQSPDGWLLCKEGMALVGVSFEAGDNHIRWIQIHCAPIYLAQGRDDWDFPSFTWVRGEMTPQVGHEDQGAGRRGGGAVRNVICPPGYVISGMAEERNVFTRDVQDLIFECAKSIGNFETLPTAGRVTWFSDGCQPNSYFAIFPVSDCLSALGHQKARMAQWGGYATRGANGSVIPRTWMHQRSGGGHMTGVDNQHKCIQFAAVGFVFMESGARDWVRSLQLTCIGRISHLRNIVNPIR